MTAPALATSATTTTTIIVSTITDCDSFPFLFTLFDSFIAFFVV